MIDKIPFFRSYREAVKKLPESERLAFYDGIIDYGLDGVVPNFDGMSDLAFTLIQPNIDSSVKMAERNKNNRNNGGCDGGNNEDKKSLSRSLPKDKDRDKEENRDRTKDSKNYYPTDNNNSCSVSNGAVAVETAPPSTPICPLCSELVRRDVKTSSWRCPNCGEIKEPAFKAVEKA